MIVLAFLNAAGLTLAISWSKIFLLFRSWIQEKTLWTVNLSDEPIKVGDTLYDTSFTSKNGYLGTPETVREVLGEMILLEGAMFSRERKHLAFEKVESLNKPRRIFIFIDGLITCPFCLGFHITNIMLVTCWIEPMTMYWLGGLTGSVITYSIYRAFFDQLR